MLHAMWLGSVFGPFLVIHGLWMLLCRANVMKVEAAVKSSQACFHIIGVVQLLVGLFIVNTCCMGPLHGVAILLVILGWLLILRAVMVFFMSKIMLKTLGNPKWNASAGIISLIWGIAICWMAFV